MVKFLVESGACLFASTLSDHETPAEKCEEDEEGFDGCSEYLYSMYTRFCDKLLFSSDSDAHNILLCFCENGSAAAAAAAATVCHFKMNQI